MDPTPTRTRLSEYFLPTTRLDAEAARIDLQRVFGQRGEECFIESRCVKVCVCFALLAEEEGEEGYDLPEMTFLPEICKKRVDDGFCARVRVGFMSVLV